MILILRVIIFTFVFFDKYYFHIINEHIMPINNYKYVHTKLLIFYIKKKKKTNILIWGWG